ncbi:MAG: sugar kinase [Armatimonadota bacterium]|nr:sugar kinase [Armatimonadota bacterium]
MPEIIALGEPMVEFAAAERGPLRRVTTFHRGFGGDTSNFIVAAARLGASCGYVTRLGDDEFGRAFLDLWAAEGVDASRVVVEPGGFTAVYFISLDEAGRHSFTYYRAGSAASRLAPSDIAADYLATARAVHTSGITQAISPSAATAAAAAMTAARARGVLVSYDANIRPRLLGLDRLRGLCDAALRLADVVFLSTEDAGYLYGASSPEDVVERVLACGPRLAVLKQGPEGCLVAAADGRRLRVPGWRVEPVDATGAGDAFDAAFLVEWLGGAPLAEAARLANAVGAMTTLGRGAVGPIPRRDAVEAFMAAGAAAPAVQATLEGRDVR